MPRLFQLPALSEDGVTTVGQALDGSYRRIRFSAAMTCLTIRIFFDNIKWKLRKIGDILSGGEFEVKVCPSLHLVMAHMVGDEETEEKIYLYVKARHLDHAFMDEMEGLFEKRLDEFTTRGSGFRLLRVEAIEWDVLEYRRIPFLVGHGNVVLPPKLAAKKAVINVQGPPGECFK
jgi:hypothetical protein